MLLSGSPFVVKIIGVVSIIINSVLNLDGLPFRTSLFLPFEAHNGHTFLLNYLLDFFMTTLFAHLQKSLKPRYRS